MKIIQDCIMGIQSLNLKEVDAIKMVAVLERIQTEVNKLDIDKDKLKQFEAIKRYCNKEQYSLSTFIDDTTTYGYGKLDSFGSWEYELPHWFVKEVMNGKS